MAEQEGSSRFETVITLTVVIISIGLSLMVWRASMAGSQASGDDRTGMINLIKQQAALNENTRKLYEEISYLREYDLLDIRIQFLESLPDVSSKAEAKNLKQILPGIAKLSELTTNQVYKNPDGSYNFEKRLEDLNQAFPETSLKPKEFFDKADLGYQEQRWLMVATVLMGLALFWTSLSEVLAGKLRLAAYIVGVLGFLGAVGLVLVIEFVVLVGRAV